LQVGVTANLQEQDLEDVEHLTVKEFAAKRGFFIAEVRMAFLRSPASFNF